MKCHAHSAIIKCNCFPPSAAATTQRLSDPLHCQHPVLLLACGDICIVEVYSGKRHKQVLYLTFALTSCQQCDKIGDGEYSCHHMTVMNCVWEIPMSKVPTLAKKFSGRWLLSNTYNNHIHLITTYLIERPQSCFIRCAVHMHVQL